MQTIVDIVIKLFLFKRAAIKNRNNSINQSSNVLQETGYKHDKSLKFVGTFMHYLTKKCFDLYQENIVKNYWHFWFKHRTHIISCVFLTRYTKRIIQFTQFLIPQSLRGVFRCFFICWPVILTCSPSSSYVPPKNHSHTVLNFFPLPVDDECLADDGSRSGICLNTYECRIQGGTSRGQCALGFGVCCICKYFPNIYIYISSIRRRRLKDALGNYVFVSFCQLCDELRDVPPLRWCWGTYTVRFWW